jgi:hypothetical protein
MIKFSEFAETTNEYTDEELRLLKELEQLENYDDRLEQICSLIIGSLNTEIPLSIYKRYNVSPLDNEKCMRRGLEIFRLLYAAEACRIRGVDEEYLTLGIVGYNDIFTDTIVDEIVSVANASPLSVNKAGATMLYNSSIASYFEDIKELVLNTIMLSAEDQFMNTAFIQRLNQGSQGHVLTDDGEDSQYFYHADIFAPSLKWWYFPEEVTLEHGPLNYSPGSCNPENLDILNFWYNESVKITSNQPIPDWKMPDHAEGSLRISKTELESYGLKMQDIVCPANTLIIANVHGFHARGKPKDWSTNIRNAVHGSIRIDPFKT